MLSSIGDFERVETDSLYVELKAGPGVEREFGDGQLLKLNYFERTAQGG